MSREPRPLFGILPSRHLCIHAHQMAGATIAPTGEKCGLDRIGQTRRFAHRIGHVTRRDDITNLVYRQRGA